MCQNGIDVWYNKKYQQFIEEKCKIQYRSSAAVKEVIIMARKRSLQAISTARCILVGCNGHVFGLDAGSGEKLWHNELPGAGHGSLSLAVEGVSVQYIEKIVETPLANANGRSHK